MKKSLLSLVFVLGLLFSSNVINAEDEEYTEYKVEVDGNEGEILENQEVNTRAEPIFNCNNWNNFKKYSSAKSTAYGLHKDFKSWSNASGYYIATGSGTQWITFSAGYKGASASVTVGSKSNTGRYFAAKYPKGKKLSRVYNNHPGTIYRYRHVQNLCPYKYKFIRSAIVYKIVYK